MIFKKGTKVEMKSITGGRWRVYTVDQGLEPTESEFEQDFQKPEKKFGARKSSIKKQVKK